MRQVKVQRAKSKREQKEKDGIEQSFHIIDHYVGLAHVESEKSADDAVCSALREITVALRALEKQVREDRERIEARVDSIASVTRRLNRGPWRA